MTEPDLALAALIAEHSRHRALILEAQQASQEAQAAHDTALSLAHYKSAAVRAALDGGVKATELAAALGISRERVYRLARGNRSAKELKALMEAQ